MYYLIAGYNTVPKEERKSFDIEGIVIIFRNTMFGMALIIIIGYAIAKWLQNPKIENYFFWIALIIGIPYLLIKSNQKKYGLKKQI